MTTNVTEPRLTRPSSRQGFEIAIICALPLEADAVRALFDIHWDDGGSPFDKAPGDTNAYSTGAVGRHNIVLVHMPGMGNVSSAIAANNCQRSFPNIKLALVVGICGVVPFDGNGTEIILGDVIISDGVFQYGLGRQLPDKFVPKDTLLDSLGRPNTKIRTLLAKLKTLECRKLLGSQIATYLDSLRHEPRLSVERPGVEYDKLFEAKYRHIGGEGLCETTGCNSNLVLRRRLQASQPSLEPVVHFGLIASGDLVMKSGEHRDAIASDRGVIAFEMESAGVWDTFPCVVIKGACDYADSHKSKAWQRYAAATAAACMKAFLSYWVPSSPLETELVVNQTRQPQEGIKEESEAEGFSVPFSLVDVLPTECFVAREKELAEIHKSLQSDGTRRTVILHGLGGIGKTQLTIAYAQQHKNDYSAIFWLNIKDEDSLTQSFTKVAKLIIRQYPSARYLSNIDVSKDLDRVIEAVKAWLSIPKNGRWLMIFDNYDNPKLPSNADPTAVNIKNFLPETDQGSIIITTRSSQIKIGHCIPIRKLDNIDNSLEILSNTSRREGLKDDLHAVRLARELDGLPLALATAGAYLYQSPISYSKYLRYYKESWRKLQKTSPELESYEDRTLYSTWQISFHQVQQQNQLSANLLRLWAYFDNQDIWFELLNHDDSQAPKWVRQLTEDEMTFTEAARVLTDYGLAEVHVSSQELIESGGYSIHACVHSWTIHILNQQWDYDLAKLALNSVGSHVTSELDAKWWLTQRRLLQHANRCSQYVKTNTTTISGTENALFYLGNLYSDQGKLDDADEMYQRALRGYEKAFGPDHPSTLNTANNLGLLYAGQDKLDKAEAMYQRALQGYKKTSDVNDTSILNTINNLGLLYAAQGKLADAEEMYQQALRGNEKALGPDHPSTLNTIRNLGNLYEAQGKLDNAEEMYRRARPLKDMESQSLDLQSIQP